MTVNIPTPLLTLDARQGGQALSTPTDLSPTLAAVETANLTATATSAPPRVESPTTTLTDTPHPTPIPTNTPPERFTINGIPYEAIVVIPDNVRQRAREIYAAGKAVGRNPHAYAKLGDSTIEAPHFMVRFDAGPYQLGPYASLQPVIDAFAGSHSRDSLAVNVGLHSWTANNPMWADKSVCAPNESPVACEIRLHNPGIILIRLGTNDVGVPEQFGSNIRQIVDTAIAAGVIPVIGTKADRHEGSNVNNEILRRIAAEYQIPLWDFDHVADTLPERGLDVDNSHMMTFFSHDYNDPTAMTRGHAMHNLTALMMLDALWREVILVGN